MPCGNPLVTLETLDMNSKEEEAANVSLNSMTGMDSPETVNLTGLVRNLNDVVLIDSGTSHNFIDEDLVKELGIPRSPTTN